MIPSDTEMARSLHQRGRHIAEEAVLCRAGSTSTTRGLETARQLLAEAPEWQQAAIGSEAEDLLRAVLWAAAATPNIATLREKEARAWMLEGYQAKLRELATP